MHAREQNLRPILIVAAVAALAGLVSFSAAAADRSRQGVTSQFDPEETVAHPAEHRLAMVLAENQPRGANVCAGYSHARSRRPNRGRMSVVLRVLRPGPRPPGGKPVLEHDFGSVRVRDDAARVCLELEVPLAAGDWLELDYRFRGRPPIRATGLGEAVVVLGEVFLE